MQLTGIHQADYRFNKRYSAQIKALVNNWYTGTLEDGILILLLLIDGK
jgi:hypothetical protein